MRKILLVLIVCSLHVFYAQAQIKINEVQSSNSKTIRDPNFNEYCDWIELYNTTTSSVNLAGFYLTDSKTEPRKWQIPTGTTIAAKGYLLIWCDSRNINLHTNFKLTTSGEGIYLYSSAMLLHDTVAYSLIETDFSYGRTVNGAGVLALLSAPTPGVSNVSTVVKGIAPKPTFSVPGGFYTANQTVAITSSVPGATIRYTIDGTEPTATSPIYTGPLTAQKTTKTTQKYGDNRLNKTGIQQYGWPSSLTYPTTKYTGTRDFGYVIKAKVFHTDYVSSYTSASTYFINMRKPTLPVVSISSDFKNFFSADTGIYIQGINGISNGYVVANWNQDWERKGHVEYFDANGVRQFGVNAGMSTMGAVSRGYDLKSLNIVMKNKYEQGEINYPLFGSSGLSKYSSFILRNSGNDWEQGNFARDGMIQSIVRGQIDLETQGYQPVVMYFNGEYWGLINMRERYDEEYFAGYNSYVDADEIDNLKLNGDENWFEASEGDSLRFEEMMAYLRTNSMSTTANYEYVKGHYLDVDNMINYYIAQFYCQNTDWPANNFRIWRPQSVNGKFRFPLFDTDFGYGLWGGEAYTNPYTNFNGSSAVTTELFDFMMLNSEFKSEFIQRFAYMINTTYSTSRLSSILNPLETAIATERDTYTNGEWTRTTGGGYNTASMISWGTSRISNMRGFLNSEYSSKGWQTLTVNFTASQGSVKLCGLAVTAGYSGQQYANTPIRLQAFPADGYQFVDWKNSGGTSLSTSQEYFATITAATTISANFTTRATVTNLKINEIMASNSTIIANELGKNEDWIEIYNGGATAIDIAGLYISDNSLIPTLHKIPYGSPELTTIPAGGYLILWADNEPQEGALHLPFRLNKDGDTLLLSQKSSSGTVTTLDNFKYGVQNTDISYGCYPNANANKIVFTVPTPNASNTVQSVTFIDGLKITEFMAKNASTVKEETGSYADWIEIYNSNATAIDLGGLFITNDITNPNMFMIPKGQSSKTTVAAGGYFILWADKLDYINPNHLDFKLNAEKGDVAIVQVRGATNYIIDQVSYTNQGEDITYGRYPTTTSSFVYLPTPTPGTVNTNSTVIAQKTGITINEVLAWNTSTVQDETGSYADFIEFYNGGSTAVDLGGLFISDSTGYTLKCRVPRNNSAATTVQPGQWITFWADGDQSQGPLHLDFNLDYLGEDVTLCQVTEAGIRQIDVKSYTTQTANVSYGRFPEGSTNWELMAPTYNAQNISLASNVSLKTLTTSIGEITPTLSASITNYVCLLPSGTTSVPTISATAVNGAATVTVTQSTSLSNTALINVISANGNYTQTYVVSFLIAPSTDASLKTLTTAAGTLSPGFSATTYSYTVALLNTNIPLVTAVPNQINALVQVAYATSTAGSTVITVTAESGAIKTYTISYTLTPTTVTTWTENFNDNTLTGWAVNDIEYTLTESNQELTSHLVRGNYVNNGYKYFYYQIPTGFLINVSANPKVIVSLKASAGMVVRIDMVDNVGRITNTNAVTKTLTTSTTYTSYTYDFTSKFTDTYGTNPGTVDNTKIVALYIMIDPGETASRDKTLTIDNLVIGATPSTVADLLTLTSSAGTLSPTFAAATTSYTLTLPAGTTTIPTISATKANANATLEISQASSVDGTATVRVTAQDNATVKTYTVDLVVTPSTVQAYTDYVIQPSMQGWTESSSLYALSYLGGEIQVNYNRTAAGGTDAITYNITDAAAKILNLATYPYFSIRLKSNVATSLRADLFDGSGYVTNSTPITKSVVSGSDYTIYTFDFTGKFSQTTPTQTVASGNIRGVKIMFDNGSTTAKSGLITIDELRFGSDVEIIANQAPVITAIPNQSIMQTQTFNNILLNNFVSDDSTPDANIVWTTNTPTNFNVSIVSNVATITAKNASWMGAETITFTATDTEGATAQKTVTFTVTELKIPVESISFSSPTVNVAQGGTINLSTYLIISPSDGTVLTTTWAESSANASITVAGVLTNALAWGTESVPVTVTVTDKNSNVYTSIITVILTGCPTQLTSVVLTPATVSVTEGQTTQLTPIYTPANACLRTVTYSSSNVSVATVSATGLVTAVIPGTTTITITVNDGFTTKTATRDVIVTKDCSGAIVLALNQSTMSIVDGSTGNLTVSFTPADECTASKIVTWSSSNTGVATVVNGVITALSEGTATITASTDGTGTTSATCFVTVLRNCNSGTVSITLDKTIISLFRDQTSTIYKTTLPVDACDSSVVWSSSNTSIATVLNGVVMPIALGTAIISCTSVQSPAVVRTVTVNIVERFPSSVSTATTATMFIGDSQTLTASVLPANADNKTVTWSTSDATKVTVNASGVITGIAQGNATITVTTVNGLTSQCLVTVQPVLATSVSLSSSTLTMLVYDEQTITATVLPVNTTNTTITWTSSNNQIATVTNGVITANEAGTTVIRGTTSNGLYNECTVTVNDILPSALTASITGTHQMFIGASETVTVNIAPINATNISLTWSSSNGNVSVTQSGVISAISVGSSVITITAVGGATTSFTVQVNPILAASISLNTTSATIKVGEMQQLIASILPVNTTNQTVTWSSNATSIATVNNAGLVTAVAEGTATITATTSNGISVTCTIIVEIIIIDVTDVILNKATTSIQLSQTETLTASVLPVNASNPTLVWSSSNPAIATVSQSGVITPVSVGNVLIIATASNGKADTCAVTTLHNPISTVSFTTAFVSLALSNTLDVSPYLSINPSYASIQSIVWSESSPYISISSNGVITNELLFGNQSTFITATVTDMYGTVKTTTLSVNLTGCPTQLMSFTANISSVLTIGQTFQIVNTLVPANACMQSAVYTSSHPSIAQVSASGVITAVALGTAIITISINDGYSVYNVDYPITVNPDCTAPIVLSLNNSTLNIVQGNTGTLTASISPINMCTTGKTIVWSSSNTAVATVSNGIVTAVSQGSAIITAVTDGTGTTTATCSVTVLSNCNAGTVTLSVDKSTINLFKTESSVIAPTVLPANSCDLSVVWSSSNPVIATVVNGVVTAVNIGTAIISCTSVQSATVIATTTVNVQERLPSSVTMSTTATIFVGDNQLVTPSVLPANADNKTVTWSSSNSAIVSVASDGTITGVSQGTATITATTVNGLTAQCLVTVNPVLATSVQLSSTLLSMYVYGSQTITANVLPTNTTNKSVIWTTSDATIATVTNGLITAIKAGVCVIRATATTGVYGECTVTVNDIVPSDITLFASITNMNVGTSQTIDVNYAPSNVTDTTLNWVSSNSGVLSVNQYGQITAVAPGTAIISVTSINGITRAITITVNPILASSISLNISSLTLRVSENQQLLANILPASTTNKSVVWTSSNATAASVDATGKITANAVGTAVITATTSNGLTATCSVTVNLYTVAVESITLNQTSVTMLINATTQIFASILPATATNQTVIWSSNGVAIASVDQTGVITAKSVGTTTITATASNGLIAQCVVTVNPILASSIVIDDIQITLGVGESTIASATIMPITTTNKTITWSVVDNSIASIAADGTITAIAPGSTSITATTVNGLVATGTITVEAIVYTVNSISMQFNSLYLNIDSAFNLQVNFNPTNATNTSLTWAVANSNIATVNSSGSVVGVSAGSTTVIATSNNGKTTTASVTVLPMLATEVQIQPTSLNIGLGEYSQLQVAVLPVRTTNKSVTWTSSNNSIVTVQNGLISGVGVGMATIYATSNNGVVGECIVNVSEILASSIDISIENIDLMVEETHQLQYVINPTNVSNPVVTWVSSDIDVLTVDANGLVTAVGQGTATVTAYIDGVQDVVDFVISIPNEAPVVSPVPEQVIVRGQTFATLDLNNYFVDDNTTGSNILWSANAGSNHLTMSINSSGIASVVVSNPQFVGTVVFTVYAQDAQGLISSTDILFTVENDDALDNVSLEVSSLVYPNPSNGLFTLQLNSIVPSLYLVEMYNASGNKLFNESIFVDGETQKTYNLISASRGVYTIVISNKIERKTLQVILR